MLLALIALAAPLHFEPSAAKPPAGAEYVAQAAGVRLTRGSIEIAGARITLPRPARALEALDPLPGASNYYAGTGPGGWRKGVPHYARVRYREAFPGIDLLVYAQGGNLEYDWIVAPGADPAAIRFSFDRAAALDPNGDVVAGPLRHRKPAVWQMVDGRRRTVPGRFVLRGRTAGFDVGPYDRTRELVIDPVIVYASNFGGSGSAFDFPGTHNRYSDTGYSVALDRWGNAYVAGVTYSTDFPLRSAAQDGLAVPCSANCGFASLFVAKFDAAGQALYSTFIAPPSPEPGRFSQPVFPGKPSIAVDADGNAFVAGATTGENFPLVNALQNKPGGLRDAFVVKLTPAGAIAWSTLLGGTGDDSAGGIAVDPYGHVWVSGVTGSRDFPITSGALRTAPAAANEAFLTRIEFTGAKLLYSTFLGPAESATLALDSALNAHVAGVTKSVAFPATPGAFQAACRGTGCADGYVIKVNPAANRIVWATYLGGAGTETLNSVALGPNGTVYVTGATESDDFPVTPGAMQNWKPAPRAAYAAVLDTGGDRLIYATYIGGSAREEGNGIAAGADGSAFVTGATGWSGFPAYRAVQPGYATGTCPGYTPSGSVPVRYYECGGPGFLTVLSPSGADLVYSTFLGGGEHHAGYAVTLDASGAAYVTGNGLSLGQGTGRGGVALLKIAPEGEPVYFRSDSVTEAAGFRPGLPRPGGIATAFVSGLANVAGVVSAQGFPLPFELAGVTVRAGGVQAPLLSVSNAGGVQQINFQVPFEAASRVVEIRHRGVSSFAAPLPVGPGIFAGAVQHGSDLRPVTGADPAAPGETIVIYATGLGPLEQTLASGYAAPGPAEVTVKPSARIGGSPAEVLYAGAAPGFAGLYQVNLRVPADVSSGTLEVRLYSNLPGYPGPPPDEWVRSNAIGLPVR